MKSFLTLLLSINTFTNISKSAGGNIDILFLCRQNLVKTFQKFLFCTSLCYCFLSSNKSFLQLDNRNFDAAQITKTRTGVQYPRRVVIFFWRFDDFLKFWWFFWKMWFFPPRPHPPNCPFFIISTKWHNQKLINF